MHKSAICIYYLYCANIAKKKRAITLILEIDEEIRSQIFDKFTNDELLHDNGIDRYLQYLKDTYGKDELVESLDCHNDFSRCKRKTGRALMIS